MIDVDTLVLRCQQWLQDENAQAYDEAQIRSQLAIEASRLANQRILGQVSIVQAVANRHYYPLDEMARLITSGTATGGSSTTLVDTGKNFVTLGVTAGASRLRDLTDGCTAIVDTVAATTLTSNEGFLGGVDNTPSSGDLYVVETPIESNRVVEVHQVYYNGVRLLKTTEDELDVRRPGWESWTGEPRYWLTDSDEVVRTIRIVPCPLRTGDATVQVPPVPFVMDWRDNLMVWLYEDAADADHPTTGLVDRYEDMLVCATVGAMAGWQTEYEQTTLASVAPQLAALWGQVLKGIA